MSISRPVSICMLIKSLLGMAGQFVGKSSCYRSQVAFLCWRISPMQSAWSSTVVRKMPRANYGTYQSPRPICRSCDKIQLGSGTYSKTWPRSSICLAILWPPGLHRQAQKHFVVGKFLRTVMNGQF